MKVLSPSALLLSLMSRVASLPFFLFTLPAGALAAMVDRRKLLRFMSFWLAGAAALLAGIFIFPLLPPTLMFICFFPNRIRFSFYSPAFAVILAERFLKYQLPPVSTICSH